MLRIKFEIKTDRPKDLTPVEYEFTNGVVSSEQFTGKKLYYTVEEENGLPGSYHLHTARKFNATGKLTGETKVKGGRFYDGHDYGSTRFAKTFHYYTLRKSILYKRKEQADNHNIFTTSKQTQKQRIPDYLINVQNAIELDGKVKFTVEYYGSFKNNPAYYLHSGLSLEIFLNIYTEK